MQQHWTEQDRQMWVDHSRKSKDAPPLSALNSKQLDVALSLERESVQQRLYAITTETNSWEVSLRIHTLH